jgi:hypothetical protein
MTNLIGGVWRESMFEKLAWVALGFIIAHMYINVVFFILNGGFI